MEINPSEFRPAGYVYLLEKFQLSGIPNWHRSWISDSDQYASRKQGPKIDEVFRSQSWPGDQIGDHLEFALKYDGVNLSLLALIFSAIPQNDILAYILSKPTGKYARRIWFFYEYLLNVKLPIPDAGSGNYVDALDQEVYYTVKPGEKSRRHRVVDNLLGVKKFCPVIRKTRRLLLFEAVDWRQKCERVVKDYPSELLRRALDYLYRKETKSSFAIEQIKPSSERIEKFVAALEWAEKDDYCEKSRLIALQNQIVDPRFQDRDYRTSQNYVGQAVNFDKQIIHFVSPKPGDLPDLMEGFIEAHRRMKIGQISPVIHAVAVAYGFVFLHPFEDGNGRIHRFLIHNVLSMQGFVPKGLMFPISAVMQKNPSAYDASLEAFSRPLMQQISYHQDEKGRLQVQNDSSLWYRFMDLTDQAEALAEFIALTIDQELVEELRFLANFDQTKRALQEIVDLPDRLIDLFIQLCVQNNGRISARKRAAQFPYLTDAECQAMEQAVQDGYSLK